MRQPEGARGATARRDYTPGELVPGTIYRVLGKIASGGMGAVYDVEDTSVGKRYVLKALHPDLCERKDLTRRMQAEARALGRLAHPNIVEVVTAGATAEEPPRPFFVMERLEGVSLRAVLDAKGRLELSHAFAIELDLLAALEHAHAHGVVHRDVKPDNLFLHRGRSATTTKLLDFGIMRIVGRSGETAGRFVGTWRYAAPEQLRGENATPQTDVYAAGLVLFEMLAGRGPFDEAGDEKQVASAHLKREAPRLASLLPVAPPLDALVAASLSKDPSRRPRSALAFAAAIRAIAVDAPASVAPASTSVRAERDTDPRPARSHAVGLLAMGALATVCVAAGIAVTTLPPAAPAVPAAAPSPSPSAGSPALTGTLRAREPMQVRSGVAAIPPGALALPPPAGDPPSAASPVRPSGADRGAASAFVPAARGRVTPNDGGDAALPTRRPASGL